GPRGPVEHVPAQRARIGAPGRHVAVTTGGFPFALVCIVVFVCHEVASRPFLIARTSTQRARTEPEERGGSCQTRTRRRAGASVRRTTLGARGDGRTRCSVVAGLATPRLPSPEHARPTSPRSPRGAASAPPRTCGRRRRRPSSLVPTTCSSARSPLHGKS